MKRMVTKYPEEEFKEDTHITDNMYKEAKHTLFMVHGMDMSNNLSLSKYIKDLQGYVNAYEAGKIKHWYQYWKGVCNGHK